ncbi:MAG: M3 family oligoendopeptidase [Bacilli bacterium]|jgi:M3 family oligoendopeptidase|nr:M3 family oligoendopeptidase [Bacilli bacterium]MCH4235877.1 M3 family oligoendopeptidase [Bacilli bacterium]
MTFEEYPLRVPSLAKVEKKLGGLIEEFKNAKDAVEAIKVVKKVNKFNGDLMTDMTIISIRFTIDTRNEIYQKAHDTIDEISPEISAIFNQYNILLVNSPFRKELEKAFGSYLFTMIDNSIKCFSPEIVPQLQTENRLTSQYAKLLAGAQIKFRGEVYNLSQLGKFMQDKDRETRKESNRLYWEWFSQNEEAIEKIYDELVHVRDEMAKKLGFKNYLELGYRRLGRVDYTPEMVAVYRDQILREVTPVWKKLVKRQAKRIKISTMKYYDMSLAFLSGNPTPIGDRAFLVEQAKEMYDTISPDTSVFFQFMLENHLLDLDAKTGKQGGGYMTYMPRYKAPFIFANFNGTSGDVDVLTHEVGHAFQGYESRNIKVPEYQSPTLEACEIHSMSMEFFAEPYMEKFFGSDADKYRFDHLAGAINFLPYGVTVDEFQAFVYEHPEATPAERNAKWREIEKKYMPLLNYSGNAFLEKGGKWMRQHHIVESPLYYIDYTLAQVVAFQFAVEMRKNYDKAWKKYVRLCKLGGRYPFVTLLEHAKLRNPFIEGNVKKVIRPLAKELAGYDDLNM